MAVIQNGFFQKNYQKNMLDIHGFKLEIGEFLILENISVAIAEDNSPPKSVCRSIFVPLPIKNQDLLVLNTCLLQRTSKIREMQK